MVSIVYMVAGMSSRFGGKIKQFARVGKNDETLIEVSINQALKAGFDKIIFIVGNMTEIPFKEKFKNSYKNIPVFYAKQTFDSNERDKPWGTCDAVVCAKELINESFVVCNGDDIYGENSFKILFDYLIKENSSATLGFELGKVIPDKGGSNRAIYSFDENNMVIGLNEIIGIEKNKLSEMNLKESTLCSMNIFALTKEVVLELEENLKNFKILNKNNRKIECYLPVELSKLINEKKLNLKLLSTPDNWLGVTNPEDEIIVKNVLSKES